MAVRRRTQRLDVRPDPAHGGRTTGAQGHGRRMRGPAAARWRLRGGRQDLPGPADRARPHPRGTARADRGLDGAVLRRSLAGGRVRPDAPRRARSGRRGGVAAACRAVGRGALPPREEARPGPARPAGQGAQAGSVHGGRAAAGGGTGLRARGHGGAGEGAEAGGATPPRRRRRPPRPRSRRPAEPEPAGPGPEAPGRPGRVGRVRALPGTAATRSLTDTARPRAGDGGRTGRGGERFAGLGRRGERVRAGAGRARTARPPEPGRTRGGPGTGRGAPLVGRDRTGGGRPPFPGLPVRAGDRPRDPLRGPNKGVGRGGG
ncbi:hypothetical protein SsS58_02881 [Streptomyces scabiei]|uniref:Uncharacterized protein n=1 Tax=Streptomyces scabiei TaxID=1930 RepID=A0A100JMZ7_STRSC|nr:hypothetical protein SsS58_02881 [Streptomyces scabiei]